MLLSKSIIFLCLFATTIGIPSDKKLSEFVSNFEELSYDRSEIHSRHTRSVRNVGKSFSLTFNAFNRNFHIRLRRDTSIFAEGFQVDSTEDGSHFPYYVCTGYLNDERYSSHVYGSVLGGRFQGQIISNGSIYYVEPADRYFKPNDVEFHSVIYMDKHVKDVGGEACGLGNELYERMKKKLKNSNNDNIEKTVEENEEKTGRVKRQSNQRRTCDLYIKADHTYYNKYRSTQAVVAAISEHVLAAGVIFQTTTFGSYTNINLAVARIKIYSTPNGNEFSEEYIGVERFLDLASSENHNQYCLSYTFADRDFSNGVLGLAWIASPSSGTSGGICDRYRSGKSLNTGIITENNYGASVPSRVSSLTFAHELGHSFGSPHDARQDCLPGNPNGNYLMYAYSSNADQPNNDKFSACSVGNITRVLNAIFGGDSGKSNCFKTMSEVSLCGNKIIESGEECDCGYENGDCTESCCVPQNEQHNAQNACRLRMGVCSPSQGPCCNNACQYRSENYICNPETDCRRQSNCRSGMAACPRATWSQDNTKCNNGTMVCDRGTCSGSICNADNNLEACLCEVKPNTPASELCQVCCQNINNPATCVPASDINILDNFKQVIYMPIGSACNNKDGNFRGYCDVFNECQNVDEDGPLASIIKRIFFSDEDSVIDALTTWLQDQWYVVLIAIVVLIALMVGTVFFCTKVIPTHNPHKREKELNRTRGSQAVKFTNRKYRGSQKPGLHPIGTDQHPDQAENKATRF